MVFAPLSHDSRCSSHTVAFMSSPIFVSFLVSSTDTASHLHLAFILSAQLYTVSGGRKARGGDEVRGVYFLNLQQRCYQRPDDHRHPLPLIGTIGRAHTEQGSPRPTCDGRRGTRAARVGEHVR